MFKLLVCGTRFRSYKKDLVEQEILKYKAENNIDVLTIIEGCCKNSADQIAEEMADFKSDIFIEHTKGKQGLYLKRNVDMVNKSDGVLAFWNGFSYGTSHTIATAVLMNKPVKIIKV